MAKQSYHSCSQWRSLPMLYPAAWWFEAVPGWAPQQDWKCLVLKTCHIVCWKNWHGIQVPVKNRMLGTLVRWWHNSSPLFQHLTCFSAPNWNILINITVNWEQSCSMYPRQASLFLHDFFLRNFTLMHLQNLHHFSNICNNFLLNVIWHRWSVAALIFCVRLAESNITVMPSVMCMNCLPWWYIKWLIYCPSTVLVFLTSSNEKCKSIFPTAIQVKNWQRTISI